MKVRRFFSAIAWVLLILTGCDGSSLSDSNSSDSDLVNSELDRAAIETGIILDPATLDLEGLFETGSGADDNRFCAVRNDDGYDVGVYVSFGREQMCQARGLARLQGEEAVLSLSRTVDDDDQCEITAVFDGFTLSFPGTISQQCQKLCSQRASLAGVSIPLVETAPDLAIRAKGNDNENLCVGN